MSNEQPLTTDPAVIKPMRLLVEALLLQLRATCEPVSRFDAEIAELCPTLTDYELFAALPGAGATLAPRLLTAFGERRGADPDPIVLGEGLLRRLQGPRRVAQAALRALAFKWIRILHRCWVDRKPYDESKYLLALQKRGAPLLKFAAENQTP